MVLGLKILSVLLLSAILALSFQACKKHGHFSKLVFFNPLCLVSFVGAHKLHLKLTSLVSSKRDVKKFESDILVVIDSLASCLKAGIGLGDAIDYVYQKKVWGTTMGVCLKTISQRRMLGMSLIAAMRNPVVLTPIAQQKRYVQLLVDSLVIGQSTGGDLIALLEKCRSKILTSMELERKVRVSTAQMRMQSQVVSFAPPVLAIGMLAVSPGNVLFFFTEASGRMLLILMIALNIVGAVSLKKAAQVEGT